MYALYIFFFFWEVYALYLEVTYKKIPIPLFHKAKKKILIIVQLLGQQLKKLVQPFYVL